MRVIVTTCSPYAFMIPTFSQAFMRAWPDCPWSIHVLHAGPVLAPVPIPSAWQFHALEEPGWASSLLDYLADSISPFLLLLDDYILDTVTSVTLARIPALFDLYPAIGMIRLHPVPGPTLPWRAARRSGLPLGEIDKRLPYAVSLQPSIWRPAVCRDLFKRGDDIWQTEILGSRRAAAYTRYTFLGTHDSLIGYRGLMRRGQPVPETVEWIKAHL